MSNQGSQLASTFTGLYSLLSISCNLSTSHRPQTDGQTEHINQEIEQYLRLFVNYHMDDWAEWLPLAEFCYNNCVSSAMGNSPFFVTKGREVNSGLNPTPSPQRPKTPIKFATRMTAIREETQAALRGAAEDMKKFYDRNYTPEEYERGDKVWLNAEYIIMG